MSTDVYVRAVLAHRPRRTLNRPAQARSPFGGPRAGFGRLRSRRCSFNCSGDCQNNLGLMLVRESQGFDLQEIRVSKEAIEINAQGMCSQLGVQTGTQPPERVGMVLLDVELF